MGTTEDETLRRRAFESLVLQGIWLGLRLLSYMRRAQGGNGCGADIGQAVWRGKAIYYFDEYGQQTEMAKAYRRESTFPEIGNER